MKTTAEGGSGVRNVTIGAPTSFAALNLRRLLVRAGRYRQFFMASCIAGVFDWDSERENLNKDFGDSVVRYLDTYDT